MAGKLIHHPPIEIGRNQRQQIAETKTRVTAKQKQIANELFLGFQAEFLTGGWLEAPPHTRKRYPPTRKPL